MNFNVLKSLISEVLITEKLRAGFNFKEFSEIEDPSEMVNYADSRLQFLGAGSSRITYLLSSGKVLKIVNDASDKTINAGLAQNKVEVDIYTNNKSKSIITKVFDHDDQFKWVTAELVRPIKSEEEFLELLGFPPNNDFAFNEIMSLAILGTDEPQDIDTKYLDKKDVELPQEAQDFINDCHAVIVNHKLMTGDMQKLDHWGKTADGRVVLLDYGYDEKVMAKHYMGPKSRRNFGYDDEGNKIKHDATTKKR